MVFLINLKVTKHWRITLVFSKLHLRTQNGLSTQPQNNRNVFKK